jgi:hypothetical protein
LKSKPEIKIRDFVFVDSQLLDKYVDQIRDSFAEIDKKSWKMSASITGPSIESSRATERIPLKPHEKIDLLEVYLEANNDLLTERPPSAEEYHETENPPKFVIESMLATKVLLPLCNTDLVKGAPSVAVWISDPNPASFIQEPYNWRGTFLYLTEIHWGSQGNSQFWSGVSALQALVNLSSGKKFFDTNQDEPLGRGRDLHPVDKLRKIGGVPVDKRKVKSLYRIRYFTNEQIYNFEGKKRRVNDILGYPVYIQSQT